MKDRTPTFIRTTSGRRLSRLRRAERQALEIVLPQLELNIQNRHKLDELIKRYKKTMLEIGFGRGDFLYSKALESPDVLFIGVEVFLTGVAKLLRRMVDYNNENNPRPENILISTEDIRIVLNDIISETILDRVYILFPDPWPKKRHHKRRLLKEDFIKLLGSRLKPDGDVIVATDCKDYAEEICRNFNMLGYRNIDTGLEEVSQTKYAQKALLEGRQIYSFRFVKKT